MHSARLCSFLFILLRFSLRPDFVDSISPDLDTCLKDPYVSVDGWTATERWPRGRFSFSEKRLVDFAQSDVTSTLLALFGDKAGRYSLLYLCQRHVCSHTDFYSFPRMDPEARLTAIQGGHFGVVYRRCFALLKPDTQRLGTRATRSDRCFGVPRASAVTFLTSWTDDTYLLSTRDSLGDSSLFVLWRNTTLMETIIVNFTDVLGDNFTRSSPVLYQPFVDGCDLHVYFHGAGIVKVDLRAKSAVLREDFPIRGRINDFAIDAGGNVFVAAEGSVCGGHTSSVKVVCILKFSEATKKVSELYRRVLPVRSTREILIPYRIKLTSTGSAVVWMRNNSCNRGGKDPRTFVQWYSIEDWPGSRVSMDGQWGSWGEWHTWRSVHGVRSNRRTRECNNPAPRLGGQYCEGMSQECSPPTYNCPVSKVGAQTTEAKVMMQNALFSSVALLLPVFLPSVITNFHKRRMKLVAIANVIVSEVAMAIGLSRPPSTIGCAFFTGLCHVTVMSSHIWLFLAVLHRFLAERRKMAAEISPGLMAKFSAGAYGIPIVLVVATVFSVGKTNYNRTASDLCWLGAKALGVFLASVLSLALVTVVVAFGAWRHTGNTVLENYNESRSAFIIPCLCLAASWTSAAVSFGDVALSIGGQHVALTVVFAFSCLAHSLLLAMTIAPALSIAVLQKKVPDVRPKSSTPVSLSDEVQEEPKSPIPKRASGVALVPVDFNLPKWPGPSLNRYYFETLPVIPEVTHEDSTWPSQDEKAAPNANIEVVESVSDSEVDVVSLLKENQ